jgi:Type II secretion system (T2SS), protein E, N-terminal domain
MSAQTNAGVADRGASEQTMRIRVDGDSGHQKLLHDYLLRLGGAATIEADGIVSVTFAGGHPIAVDEYLASWSGVNRVEAEIEADPSPSLPEQYHPLMAATRPRSGPPVRVGDLLVSKGMITADQLSEALVESKSTGELLGRVLLRRRFVFEPELARTLAEQWELPYLNLALLDVNPAVVRLLPPEVGTVFAAIPVRTTANGVQVAFADPSDVEAVQVVRTHVANIDPAVADLSDILAAWRRVTGGR